MAMMCKFHLLTDLPSMNIERSICQDLRKLFNYHPTRSSPSTASKCWSWLRSGRRCCPAECSDPEVISTRQPCLPLQPGRRQRGHHARVLKNWKRSWRLLTRICRPLEGSQDVTNLGWSVGVLIGRGFAPACSTHVVPRPCRCKHGAPVKAPVQHFRCRGRGSTRIPAFICFCLMFSAFSPGIKSRSAVLRRNRLVQIQIRGCGIPRHDQPDFFLMRAARSLGEEKTADGSCGSVAAISTAPAPPYDAHFSAVPRSRAMMRDNQAKVQYSPVSGEQR